MRRTVAPVQEGLVYETYCVALDSFEELIDIAEETNNLPRVEKYDRSSIYGTLEFTGTESMTDAIDLARYGWPEGAQMLQDAADAITVPPVMGDTIRPEMFYDVVGSEPDVGRYLGGEPENMVDFRLPLSPQGNVVELVVNCSQSWRTSKQAIMRRGAAVLAAVEAMQSNGYSTAVTMGSQCSSQYYPRKEMTHFVPIIEPGGYVDVDRLAFAMGHPSFLRRMIFAVQETEPSKLRRHMGFMSSGNYGYPRPLTILPAREHPVACVDKHEGFDGGAASAQRIVDVIAEEIAYVREHGRKTVKAQRA